MQFNGKVALITGGSSGIGLATARLLAEAGAHTWLLARREDVLRDAQAEVKSCRVSSGQFCRILAADVSDLDQVNRAVSEVVEQSGVPDLVINSAGVVQPGYFQDLDVQDFHWMMDVNYYGSLYVTKALLPGMLQRGSGHIVNISSFLGILGLFGYTGYSASKFALIGFSDALRAEVKPHGICLHIVIPPDTDTPQYAYDAEKRPREINAMVRKFSSVVSPNVVAEAILRGIIKKKYVITPGFETTILYWLRMVTGRGAYPVVDWLMAWANRTNNRTKDDS